MKPLKRGANRTALTDNIVLAIFDGDEEGTTSAFSLPVTQDISYRLSALIGGALEETLRELNGSLDSTYKAAFWRYFNHNLWNLTRSLRASDALKDV